METQFYRFFPNPHSHTKVRLSAHFEVVQSLEVTKGHTYLKKPVGESCRFVYGKRAIRSKNRFQTKQLWKLEEFSSGKL